MKTAALLVVFAGLAASASAATPDLASCDVYKPACHYTASSREASYDINRVVIHKTEGATAAGAASWFANCDSPGSAHYSFDKSNGYCYQSVLEKDIAWHAGYWNTQVCSIGIEHSGWVTNNDTSTACYDESAVETRSCVTYYGVPCNRSYIIAHSEVPGCSTPGGGGKNCHTDPGRYWNWGYYMAKCSPGAGAQNPPYWFDSGTDGWYAGNASSAIQWTSGYSGSIYADQTGNDMVWLSPSTGYTGGVDHSVNVSIFPQSGSGIDHQVQLFYKTNASNFWDAPKATQLVNYSGRDAWYTINLDIPKDHYLYQTVNQLRLDLDNTSVGARFIVDRVALQQTPRWWFASDTNGWYQGNGTAAPWWTASGWPGILVVDQTAGDPFIFGPVMYPYYRAAGNDEIEIKVYVQGSWTSHDMQLHFITTDDQTWSSTKSTDAVQYSGNNFWHTLTFPIGKKASYRGRWIKQFRLDFDGGNNGNRFLIDSIQIKHTTQY